MKKKLLSLLAVSVLGLSACGEAEPNDVEGQSETAVQEDSIVVVDSAEQTAERIANKYDYEMVESLSTDSEIGEVIVWEFNEQVAVFGHPNGELLYAGFSGLTGSEVEDTLSEENFSIPEELQEILTISTFDEYLESGMPEDYETTEDGIHLLVSPEITMEDEVFFTVFLSNASYMEE